MVVFMVKTVAARLKRIAPEGAQSEMMLMLRFGRSKMLEMPELFSEMNRWFLVRKNGNSAMTLTPPRASGRAAGSRLAGRLVAKRADKQTTN